MYKRDVDQSCGKGGKCTEDQAEFEINSRIRSSKGVTPRDCMAMCDTEPGCGGFVFDQKDDTPNTQCIWRGNTACNIKSDVERDCYTKQAANGTSGVLLTVFSVRTCV